MGTVIQMPNKRSWEFHAKRIAAAWGKQVESIVETGQALIEAKEELEHGSWLSMVQLKLPFGPSMAQKLIAVAKHSVLSNAAHVLHLPPSWGTLYQLSQLPPEDVVAGLKDGSIHSKLERREVTAMLANLNQTNGERILALVEASDAGLTKKQIGAKLPIVEQSLRNTLRSLRSKGQLAWANALRDGDRVYVLGSKEEAPPPEKPKAEAPAELEQARAAYMAALAKLPLDQQPVEVGRNFFDKIPNWTTKQMTKCWQLTTIVEQPAHSGKASKKKGTTP